MTGEELLRGSLISLEVDEAFSEAILHLRDRSRLTFCHRVDERWAKADRTDNGANEPRVAEMVLAKIAMFRLNGKHLDIQFTDGSRWEARFQGDPAPE